MSTDAVFFDFDGVIKDSMEVKSDAFAMIFSDFGEEVSSKVRSHHEANGGMSRYKKIPLYLSWAGLSPSNSLIKKYIGRFSRLVKQQVIDCEWVAGVEEFIYAYNNKIKMFVVTATPQSEIEEILEALEIYGCFIEVVGAPAIKKDAVKELVRKYSVDPQKSVMIGDSMSDFQAASENHVVFVLRKTQLNVSMQTKLDCAMIDNFIDFGEVFLGESVFGV